MKRYFVQIQDWDGYSEESFSTAGEAVAWVVEQSRHRSSEDNKSYPPTIIYGEQLTPDQLNEIALSEAKEKS